MGEPVGDTGHEGTPAKFTLVKVQLKGNTTDLGLNRGDGLLIDGSDRKCRRVWKEPHRQAVIGEEEADGSLCYVRGNKRADLEGIDDGEVHELQSMLHNHMVVFQAERCKVGEL